MIIKQLTVREVPIWVEFWGLPIEFQCYRVARKLGSLVGIVLEVDRNPNIPRNIRFLHVKVCIRLEEPLLMGTMISLDTESFAWVTIRYERVFNLCQQCGRIGYSYPHCP